MESAVRKRARTPQQRRFDDGSQGLDEWQRRALGLQRPPRRRGRAAAKEPSIPLPAAVVSAAAAAAAQKPPSRPRSLPPRDRAASAPPPPTRDGAAGRQDWLRQDPGAAEKIAGLKIAWQAAVSSKWLAAEGVRAADVPVGRVCPSRRTLRMLLQGPARQGRSGVPPLVLSDAELEWLLRPRRGADAAPDAAPPWPVLRARAQRLFGRAAASLRTAESSPEAAAKALAPVKAPMKPPVLSVPPPRLRKYIDSRHWDMLTAAQRRRVEQMPTSAAVAWLTGKAARAPTPPPRDPPTPPASAAARDCGSAADKPGQLLPDAVQAGWGCYEGEFRTRSSNELVVPLCVVSRVGDRSFRVVLPEAQTSGPGRGVHEVPIHRIRRSADHPPLPLPDEPPRKLVVSIPDSAAHSGTYRLGPARWRGMVCWEGPDGRRLCDDGRGRWVITTGPLPAAGVGEDLICARSADEHGHAGAMPQDVRDWEMRADGGWRRQAALVSLPCAVQEIEEQHQERLSLILNALQRWQGGSAPTEATALPATVPAAAAASQAAPDAPAAAASGVRSSPLSTPQESQRSSSQRAPAAAPQGPPAPPQPWYPDARGFGYPPPVPPFYQPMMVPIGGALPYYNALAPWPYGGPPQPPAAAAGATEPGTPSGLQAVGASEDGSGSARSQRAQDEQQLTGWLATRFSDLMRNDPAGQEIMQQILVRLWSRLGEPPAARAEASEGRPSWGGPPQRPCGGADGEC